VRRGGVVLPIEPDVQRARGLRESGSGTLVVGNWAHRDGDGELRARGHRSGHGCWAGLARGLGACARALAVTCAACLALPAASMNVARFALRPV